MHYSITHRTTYRYASPVALKPHVLRLYPRSDSWQQVVEFSLAIVPEPIGRSDYVDLDGNNLIKLWFDNQSNSQLDITTNTTVITQQNNPFNYLLDPYSIKLPIDYPASILSQLQPYFSNHYQDPEAIAIAQNLMVTYDYDSLQFLNQLNQLIYRECRYGQRELGPAQPAGLTWRSRQGSCRDFVVLFMAVCRAAGLATRFVSGYQEGDLTVGNHTLHAWAEVYLPGGGWRGYDPTLGLVVSDRHIALVAAPLANQTLPILGTYLPTVTAKLEVDVILREG